MLLAIVLQINSFFSYIAPLLTETREPLVSRELQYLEPDYCLLTVPYLLDSLLPLRPLHHVPK